LRGHGAKSFVQVLALVAMEPPVTLEAESIRDEKVKLLKAIRQLLTVQVAGNVVRGQYAEGKLDGQPRVAYRQEVKVKPDSSVETFVAARFLIDNWRWSGVPFYLRTGQEPALECERSARAISPDAERSCSPPMRSEARCPMPSHCACNPTKASRFVSTGRFPARACSCVRTHALQL
jgi:hypothetical protein